ncbi:MAG: DUF1361 domain-containing protein [Saprospiraceae bacterium]|nr:DUF1361 domain-containing protein [Saprospiraceae bacterium]
MTYINQKSLITLGVVTVLNILMLLIRNAIENDNSYNFLFFNLFLGLVPLLVAFVALFLRQNKSIYVLVAISFIWLLFYPNAPYMITDLIHVQAGSHTVVYDALIIFSISILSLFYGFFSLKIVHDIWISKFSKKVAYSFLMFSIVLASFGIYLGRILRLNSWDLFTNPWKVVVDIFEHLWPLSKNPTTYYIIILFSLIQIIILYLTKDLDFDEV